MHGETLKFTKIVLEWIFRLFQFRAPLP